jgi:hypothetical protein
MYIRAVYKEPVEAPLLKKKRRKEEFEKIQRKPTSIFKVNPC